MKIAYTICSANYLPFAKALADSLVQHNSAYTFIIALADTHVNFEASFFAPHKIIPVAAMQLASLEEMNSKYTIFELSCALKPYVANYLFEQNKHCEALFYFDSDILVYGPLTQAENILQNHSLILTPHIAMLPKEYKTSVDTELNVLRTGLYNAGFFGFNKSSETFAFLEWWKERMKDYSINDASHGLFVDQLWLNFAPLYVRSTFILYDPGYNLAYWNFSERTLTKENETYLVNDKHPLIFFHFSGYDIHLPDIISKHQKMYTFENVPQYFPLFEDYKNKALRNNNIDFFSLQPAFGKCTSLPTKNQNNSTLLSTLFNKFKGLLPSKSKK